MPNTYTLIQAQTLTTSTASVTFSSIPATYTDLLLKVSVRTARATTSDALSIKLNNSTSSYSSRNCLNDNGSAVSYTDMFGVGYVINTKGNSTTANTFSNQEIYIPNYAGSNYKSFSSESVVENNATDTRVEMMASLWSDGSAVTSIVIASYTANNLLQYSTFYLYGIKNS